MNELTKIDNINELTKYSFESIERAIYEYVCEIGRNITVSLLEQLDVYLMQNRDMKIYKSKDIRKTTIKTVYGEVEYSRRMYYDTVNKRPAYLLDEEIQMEKIGTISTNLAKRIAEATIDMPFRKAAETISSNTGQTISSRGVWNVTQQIGKAVQAEEEQLVREMKSEQTRGEIESGVIFQEADGVYLNIQKNKKKAKSQELKLATIYDGWSKDGSRLHQKKVYIGMETATKFNEKTEALIQSVYNIDCTEIRVVNGDGAGWIKNTYEPDRIFQLDRFHIKKEIRRSIPEPPNELTHKNMGVQENQNCSLVCIRMKDRKMRWSIEGANNLSKLIYTKENGDLDRIIEEKDGVITLPKEIDFSQVLSSSKVQKKLEKAVSGLKLSEQVFL